MNSPTDDDLQPYIFLVEDDPALGKALSFALQVEGYSVELLDRAEALLDVIFPEGPIVIVTDLNLPGLSGVAALEALRLAGVTAPAILITTQPTRALRARARDVDAMIVEKPILGSRLADAIRSLGRTGPARGP